MGAGQKSNRRLFNSPGLEQFKYETARELGINYQPGMYMGDVPARQNGAIGGNMVKKMIASYEQSLANGNAPATPQVTNRTMTP